MKSIIFGIVFWAVLLGVIWLIRPKSKLLGITMERWTIWHRLVTVLLLAALIGSESYLMTLCPMWNGEITAQIMKEIEERKAGKTDGAGEALESGEVPGADGAADATPAAAADGENLAAAADENSAAAADDSEEEPDPDRFAIKNKNQYELMADALLNKQIYLDYGDMDPRLLAMENPYDYDARVEQEVWYHWDHAFYKGRYYMYFGVVPVFLLFIPYKLITGMSLTTFHATQIFVGLAMIGLFAFFRLLSKRFFPRLSFAVYLFLGAAVSLASMVHCIAKPAMYMTAFAAGICMEIWSVYFYIKAVWATENENHAIFRAFLGALSGAMAFGCRPSIALANLVVIPCLIVFLRQRKFTGKLFLKLLAAASPYFIIGALLLLYNYVRFESPFEFGQSYQLTVTDQSGYSSLLSRLNARDLINGVAYFLVRNEYLTEDFPFVEEGGVFFSYPVFATGLFALTSKKVRAALNENKLVLFTMGAVFSIFVIILMDDVWSPYLLSRYMEDLMWLVGMLAFLMVGLRYADSRAEAGASSAAYAAGAPESTGDNLAAADTALAEDIDSAADTVSTVDAAPAAVFSGGTENAEFGFAVCLLAIYSIFICAFVFVKLDMEYFLPEQIEFIEKIFGGLIFGL